MTASRTTLPVRGWKTAARFRFVFRRLRGQGSSTRGPNSDPWPQYRPEFLAAGGRQIIGPEMAYTVNQALIRSSEIRSRRIALVVVWNGSTQIMLMGHSISGQIFVSFGQRCALGGAN